MFIPIDSTCRYSCSTKTLYNYIHQGLLEIKVIDLPRAVRIRKKFNKRPLPRNIQESQLKKDQKRFNNRSCFEIGNRFVLGGKTIGEPSILTLVERQTRYVVTKKLVEKSRVCQSSSLRVYETYPIKSITADNRNEFLHH